MTHCSVHHLLSRDMLPIQWQWRTDSIQFVDVRGMLAGETLASWGGSAKVRLKLCLWDKKIVAELV